MVLMYRVLKIVVNLRKLASLFSSQNDFIWKAHRNDISISILNFMENCWCCSEKPSNLYTVKIFEERIDIVSTFYNNPKQCVEYLCFFNFDWKNTNLYARLGSGYYGPNNPTLCKKHNMPQVFSSPAYTNLTTIAFLSQANRTASCMLAHK